MLIWFWRLDMAACILCFPKKVGYVAAFALCSNSEWWRGTTSTSSTSSLFVPPLSDDDDNDEDGFDVWCFCWSWSIFLPHSETCQAAFRTQIFIYFKRDVVDARKRREQEIEREWGRGWGLEVGDEKVDLSVRTWLKAKRSGPSIKQMMEAAKLT